jgi:hypothetical protein
VQNPSTGCTFFRPAGHCFVQNPSTGLHVLPPGRPLIAGPAHRATDSCTATAVAGVALLLLFFFFFEKRVLDYW